MIKNNFKKRIFTSIILLLLIVLVSTSNLALVFCLLVLGVISFLEFLNITKKIFKNKFYFFISNFIFESYVFIFCYSFLILSNLTQLKIILFCLLLGCVASDIGGFIFGKILKGPKLTKISPNKTYSGALGSILLSSLVFYSLIYYFTKNSSFIFVIVAIITSVACQFGDLFFSYLKRKAKIKDTGDFLPGHGGVLDRLDGIFFGVPAGFIALAIFY